MLLQNDRERLDHSTAISSLSLLCFLTNNKAIEAGGKYYPIHSPTFRECITTTARLRARSDKHASIHQQSSPLQSGISIRSESSLHFVPKRSKNRVKMFLWGKCTDTYKNRSKLSSLQGCSQHRELALIWGVREGAGLTGCWVPRPCPPKALASLQLSRQSRGLADAYYAKEKRLLMSLRSGRVFDSLLQVESHLSYFKVN